MPKKTQLDEVSLARKPKPDYEKKFKELVKLIKEIIILETKWAQMQLLKEIKDGSGFPRTSWRFAENVLDYYDLLKTAVDASNFIPPDMVHLEECMRELIAKKEKVTSLKLKALYQEKYPDEPVGKYCFL